MLVMATWRRIAVSAGRVGRTEQLTVDADDLTHDCDSSAVSTNSCDYDAMDGGTKRAEPENGRQERSLATVCGGLSRNEVARLGGCGRFRSSLKCGLAGEGALRCQML